MQQGVREGRATARAQAFGGTSRRPPQRAGSASTASWRPPPRRVAARAAHSPSRMHAPSFARARLASRGGCYSAPRAGEARALAKNGGLRGGRAGGSAKLGSTYKQGARSINSLSAQNSVEGGAGGSRTPHIPASFHTRAFSTPVRGRRPKSSCARRAGGWALGVGGRGGGGGGRWGAWWVGVGIWFME